MSTPSETFHEFGKPASGWRRDLYTIIFEADTPAGMAFDVTVIVTILLSVAVVMADSMQAVTLRYGGGLAMAEYVFTALFTIEYIGRLICVRHPARYATSFYGVIDLLSVLPTYLAIFWPDSQLLIDVRILRLLRVFRIFRLTAYLTEFTQLGQALHASRRKIFVFLSFVLMVVLVMGTLMYVVEGPANGFTSIPISMYWAVTTMTTVGYGDLTPHTSVGRLIASVMMLTGWGVLAVPTGIVSAEMTAQRHGWSSTLSTRSCNACGATGHTVDATYCASCGSALPRL